MMAMDDVDTEFTAVYYSREMCLQTRNSILDYCRYRIA